jgi:aminopeptidase N
MTDTLESAVRRSDYRPPAFWIRRVDLEFDLEPTETTVKSRMRIQRNRTIAHGPLRLHGEELALVHARIDGVPVTSRHEGNELVLDGAPDDDFTLEIVNRCAPERNTALSGLYTSSGSFFTQCEAEGFRRITYFLDRPDVMAVYSVTLRADKSRFPVLLSNGNLTASGDLDGGRHFAVWSDPFPKPSYLFALVAGDLVVLERSLRSAKGTEHLLQLYVRDGDLGKTSHAMNSLIKAIKWDEERFGLALDLERFMVVGVSDFNAGAMENKGLNIFNTAALLASQATATDSDFATIESVVAHEYLHNWTGNRVTCRDWFQLSLKEGLTVFRHQEFAMDTAGGASARSVRRIQDVRLLRALQFPEDSGAMAHSVRPDSYSEISNFYTATVYIKGAEVVRMIQTLLGRAGFEAGLRLYFDRHDGQAVTCDDFAAAMADANPGSALAKRLDAFKRWYSQAGTPHIQARGVYDAAARRYSLQFAQRTPTTPDRAAKAPLVIPVALALFDSDGRALPLQLEGEASSPVTERVLVLDRSEHTFVFEGVDRHPVPSLLRGFSAPVVLDDGLSEDALLVLMRHDTDAFSRCEAGQRLALDRILAALRVGEPLVLPPMLVDAMRSVLLHAQLDPAFKALALTLPTESYIAEQLDVVDPKLVHEAVTDARRQLAGALRADWAAAFEANLIQEDYAPSSAQSGRRALANLALSMLVLDAQATGEPTWPERALARFVDADNMTDRLGSLSALVHAHDALAEPALDRFHTLFQDDALVIDKWFATQAGAPEFEDRVFERVQQLALHPAFTQRNPNRAISLLATLCLSNPSAFHRADARGYLFWADQVLEIDSVNPYLAGRLARAMDRWATLAEPYRSGARDAVARVAASADLSGNVREIIDRALASGHQQGLDSRPQGAPLPDGDPRQVTTIRS